MYGTVCYKRDKAREFSDDMILSLEGTVFLAVGFFPHHRSKSIANSPRCEESTREQQSTSDACKVTKLTPLRSEKENLSAISKGNAVPYSVPLRALHTATTKAWATVICLGMSQEDLAGPW